MTTEMHWNNHRYLQDTNSIHDRSKLTPSKTHHHKAYGSEKLTGMLELVIVDDKMTDIFDHIGYT